MEQTSQHSVTRSGRQRLIVWQRVFETIVARLRPRPIIGYFDDLRSRDPTVVQ
jgi:hypothetical protein